MTRKKGEMPRSDAFLAAALKRFSRHGYAATSTREICGDLGLAHSAIYNYFPSKEAVILAIEEREMTKMQAGLEAVLAENSGRSAIDRLRIAIRYTFGVAARDKAAWRLMTEMLRSLKPRNRSAVIARRDRYERVIRELIEEAVAEGDLPPQDVRLASLYLFGIAEGISGWFKDDGLLDVSTLSTHAADFVIRAMISVAPTLQSERSEIASKQPEGQLSTD